jgi:hypothetical protein
VQIATKVKHFFFTHAINRHKMTTLTPSVHLVSSASATGPVLADMVRKSIVRMITVSIFGHSSITLASTINLLGSISSQRPCRTGPLSRATTRLRKIRQCALESWSRRYKSMCRLGCLNTTILHRYHVFQSNRSCNLSLYSLICPP